MGRNINDSFVTRSDIGDPEYLGGLAKRYNAIIDTEVTNMKKELGGVEIIGKDPYELYPGKELFEGYERVSLNPSWYREWWQKHYRAPREGEWRDLAIKNLIEGNPETGEPANEEFLPENLSKKACGSLNKKAKMSVLELPEESSRKVPCGIPIKPEDLNRQYPTEEEIYQEAMEQGYLEPGSFVT